MPKRVSIFNLKDEFNKKKNGDFDGCPVYNINHITGVSSRWLGYTLIKDYGLYYIICNPSTIPLGIISEDDAAAEMSMIESFAKDPTSIMGVGMRGYSYRHIKQDPRWQHLYHYGKLPVNFLRTDTGGENAVLPQALDTYPCHYCGIILPEQFMEVDHRQPESMPGIAVIKVLRAMNKDNIADPTHIGGTKARNRTAIHAASTATQIAALPRVPINGWDFGTPWGRRPNTTNRYQLSMRGITLYALQRMYWGDTCDNYSVYSFLNLVPACRACNGTSEETGKGAVPYATKNI